MLTKNSFMRVIKAASQPLPKSKETSAPSDRGDCSDTRTRPHNSVDTSGKRHGASRPKTSRDKIIDNI